MRDNVIAILPTTVLPDPHGGDSGTALFIYLFEPTLQNSLNICSREYFHKHWTSLPSSQPYCLGNRYASLCLQYLVSVIRIQLFEESSHRPCFTLRPSGPSLRLQALMGEKLFLAIGKRSQDLVQMLRDW
jgi:hypothetical protein